MSFAEFWPVLILAVAISADGFGVGITYGIRQIRIGILPLIIIGLISTFCIYIAGVVGAVFGDLMSPEIANYTGSFILILIGLWLIYKAFNNLRHESEETKLLISFKIKFLGIIINILKEPARADFDESGNINILEALFLGLALALDALGAGIGVGLTGFPTLTMALVIGIMSLLFVGSGVLVGKRVGKKLPSSFKALPGLIIIFLGLINLI